MGFRWPAQITKYSPKRYWSILRICQFTKGLSTFPPILTLTCFSSITWHNLFIYLDNCPCDYVCYIFCHYLSGWGYTRHSLSPFTFLALSLSWWPKFQIFNKGQPKSKPNDCLLGGIFDWSIDALGYLLHIAIESHWASPCVKAL